MKTYYVEWSRWADEGGIEIVAIGYVRAADCEELADLIGLPIDDTLRNEGELTEHWCHASGDYTARSVEVSSPTYGAEYSGDCPLALAAIVEREVRAARGN